MTFVLLAKQGKPFPGNGLLPFVLVLKPDTILFSASLLFISICLLYLPVLFFFFLESQNYTEFDGPLFSSFHLDGAIPESALMSPRHLRRMKRVQNRALLKSGQLLDKQHPNHSTDQREAIDTDLAAGVSLIPRLPLHALRSSQARVSESMSNRPSYSASRLRDFNGERDALSSRSSSVRFAPLPLDDMTSILESPVSSRASTSLSFRSSALMSPRSRVAVSQEISTESASSQAISSLKLRPATTSSICSTTNRSSSTYGGDIQSPPHTSRESTFQRTYGGESLDYSTSLFSARTPLTDRCTSIFRFRFACMVKL